MKRSVVPICLTQTVLDRPFSPHWCGHMPPRQQSLAALGIAHATEHKPHRHTDQHDPDMNGVVVVPKSPTVLLDRICYIIIIA